MERYRFVAVDASGNVKRGSMNAESRSDAVARIERHGLQVRELAPANGEGPESSSLAGVFSPSAEGIPHSSSSGEEEYAQAETRGRNPSIQSRPSRLPLFLSAAALLVAIAALGIATFRSPLGRGIRSYDLSSPEAAVKSLVQIQKGHDLKAQLDLTDLQEGNSGEEMIRTLEIHRKADFNDKKILFVSYTRKGTKIKSIETFEKDPESKMWLPKFLSNSDVSLVNEQLAKEMKSWNAD